MSKNPRASFWGMGFLLVKLGILFHKPLRNRGFWIVTKFQIRHGFPRPEADSEWEMHKKYGKKP